MRVKVIQTSGVALTYLAEQVDPLLLLDAIGRLNVKSAFFANDLVNKTNTNYYNITKNIKKHIIVKINNKR